MFDNEPWLAGLNAQQRAVVEHGGGPLLVVAGAGSGKTRTLASRVAGLLAAGVAAERILLLTFTRRAAQQLLRHATTLAASASGDGLKATAVVPSRMWGGTFHAVGNRLLRRYGRALGLRPEFSVIDQGDAADLIDLVRDDLGVATGDRRFPRKDTLATISSRTVNAGRPVSVVLARHYPWCADQAEAIIAVLRAYTERKRKRHVLDYDDLLLWWRALLDAPRVGEEIATAFDHVLVDEYQDTNTLQADILAALRRSNPNLTVVGDDAQAIYGFRAATVENILQFPKRFPGAIVLRLEQNYRSTQPILDTANAVLRASPARWDKTLWSTEAGGPRPCLHTCHDEAEQSDRVCEAVLERREQGVPLRQQAVLFRTGHHSDHLEVELSRRNIPFVKFGGLRFLEAAHVKDLLALLRLLENPDDEVAWFRALQLLDGVGPATARRMQRLLHADTSVGALRHLLDDPPRVPPGASEDLEAFREAVADCMGSDGAAPPVSVQVERLRRFYEPLCVRAYDDAAVRLRDLEQLELIATGYDSRARFVTDLVLDPPSSTADLAGPPLLDEDYLILSTIHSAKGLEWDAVYLLHAVDGMLPSDLACGTPEELEEERRLLYVALTRARRDLHLFAPLRYYHQRFRPRDRHGYAQLSRFLTSEVQGQFDRRAPAAPGTGDQDAVADAIPVAVGDFLKDLWR
jgi:DNA helicase II / ATP-dependent DNA helicase PcrA